MSVLLTIVASVVIIIGIVLIVAAVTKSEYNVGRSVIINKPQREVFDYIKYLKNQDNYSVWAMMDPSMAKTFEGVDGTPGFKSSWDSSNKKVGKGEQELKNVVDGERIESELHFIKPFDGRANAHMVTDAIGADSTKVNWGFSSKMAYPMNIMLLFMNMDKMMGKDLEVGLQNLKKVLET
ncbi:SRPBCC family protein [Mucilaginibacter agri]|uniref:Polyketide cyclase n=1 Tax=Mucilaginibacter agri TaxID=2695265 RepID=A0A965ZF41_9SPHI|nr:SRPBCC family protein [Mucilaginibacter agri]NCD69560.1 polyketide cyclase [Mucilaginibacter agri]